jgi:hypothetical protein
MPQEVSIGLAGNQIMQRFLVRKIYAERELRLVEIDGTSHLGFVTGFDETCIQISTTPLLPADEPHSVLLFWPLRRIEETGSGLDSLDDEHRQLIRKTTSVLRSQCESIVRQNGKDNTDARQRSRGRVVSS